MSNGDIDSRRGTAAFGELALPVALIGLSAYLWTLADAFTGGARRYEAIGPSFLPKLLLAILVVLCVAQVATSLVRRRGAPRQKAAKPIHWRDLGSAFAITASYAALLFPVGFLIATPLFQAAMLAIVFRVRRPVVATLAPLGLTIGLSLLFVGVMNAPLPRGRWLFGDFSRLFY